MTASSFRAKIREKVADDPTRLSRAQALTKRTFEFAEYLVDVLGVTDPSISSPIPAAQAHAGQCLDAHWDGTLDNLNAI
jgi:hypothetical protein